MAGPSVESFLSECYISVSQEEVLANLGGGWERSGLYSLDETPSQNFLNSPPPRVQLDSLNMRTEPPASYEGDSGSESSEASEYEGGMRMSTVHPVHWIPPSSPEASVGAARDDGVAEGDDGVEEGDDGVAEGDGMAKEDSYVAAFESDRSQSPSQDWHGQAEQPEESEQPDSQAHIPNLCASAEFLTQPLAGVMDFQFASSEDLGNQILRRETVPALEYQVLPLSIPSIPEDAVSVIEAPIAAMELSLQPFTQPAVEIQPLEPLNLETLNKLQESGGQTQLEGERNEIVHDVTLLDKEVAGAEEPEPVQQGSERDESVNDASTLDNDNGCAGDNMPQEGEEDGFPSDSQPPVGEIKDLKSTEHMQQEHESHVITQDTPYVGVQRGDPGPSDKAQPPIQISKVFELGTGKIPSDSDQREQMQRSDGDTRPFSKALKRVNSAEELHGRQKLQRIEASPVGARSFPKTVMDVVRSRSRSLSNSLVDDECNILSIIMRAGIVSELDASVLTLIAEKRLDHLEDHIMGHDTRMCSSVRNCRQDLRVFW